MKVATNLLNHLKTCPTYVAWQKIKPEDHHGIMLPLSSLRTKKSLGIGEFLDLLPVIDFCKKIGFSVIQLLPLNDSFLTNSPYDPVSSLALNPIYLSLVSLPFYEKNTLSKKGLKKLKALDGKSSVAYLEVYQEKLNWLRQYFENFYKQYEKRASYVNFIKDNTWLQSYALFLILKNKFGNMSWKFWDDKYKNIQIEYFNQLLKENEQEVNFYSFLQYLCYLQMQEVKKYSLKKSVYLMGDIPILVGMESADVWINKSYFNTELTAGALPDAYSKEGQNWGFPVYQWQAIENEGLSYWKKRLSYAEHFYSLYRLDHVAGFFRIWAIKATDTPKNGFFIPSTEVEWRAQGERILTSLALSTSMLPIAEDLGTVPEFVREVLYNLGICSTKVMRWERNWKSDLSYINPHLYPRLSYTTVSTHDSSPLALWWQEEEEGARVWAEEKRVPYPSSFTKKERFDLLKASHESGSLFHINPLNEYLAFVTSFVSKNLQDERINTPGTLSEKNWSYRIRITFEKIANNPSLKKIINKLLC